MLSDGDGGLISKEDSKFNIFSLFNQEVLVMFVQYPWVRQCVQVCPPCNVTNYWTDLHECSVYITFLYPYVHFVKPPGARGN